MVEAIADTGPILHLHEIGRLPIVAFFERLVMPDLVAGELSRWGLDSAQFSQAGLSVAVERVVEQEWRLVIGQEGQQALSPADAQVVVLARSGYFSNTVLTDDLKLRRYLESQGFTVVGSFGVLVRAYSKGVLRRTELERAVDELFANSTLYMSRGFRAYIQRLLSDLK